MNLYQNQYRTKSIRLPNRDYTQNGWYFVTICTYKKINYFGDIINTKMQRSPIGDIAQQYWVEIPQHHQNIFIDTFIIMPNHIHGIIIIENPKSRCRDVAGNVSTQTMINDEYNLPKVMSQISPKAGSLSTIIRSYKSAVTRWCGQNKYNNFAWQPRFYDHIIRNDGSLERIREYIINNPIKWEEDKNNPINLWI
ncbi:transposase [Crocosphaera sp. UHCC 0190]|uniref:transposase n=1 Tax=Crocosphaera sp. UHCC 0190 TaxID=3110246 RepID=UPI002B1FC384|nr:transposase [Crocosphaera sp. UHCC 0190]MEA5510613.1 transposase [Crocosphaera sp. UHCC 0190]